MKKLIIIMLASVCALTASAQIGGGARLSYNKFLGTEVGTIGIGAYGNYWRSDNLGFRGGVVYGLPWKQTSTFTASALDNFTDPQTIQVEGETTVGTFHINVDGVRYFGSGDYDDGGVYGVLGIGLVIASEQTEYESYSSTYSVTGFSDEGAKETYTQYMIRGFVGYDHALSDLHLFGELGIGLPANTIEGVAVPVQIGSYFEVSAGIRF